MVPTCGLLEGAGTDREGLRCGRFPSNRRCCEICRPRAPGTGIVFRRPRRGQRADPGCNIDVAVFRRHRESIVPEVDIGRGGRTFGDDAIKQMRRILEGFGDAVRHHRIAFPRQAEFALVEVEIMQFVSGVDQLPDLAAMQGGAGVQNGGREVIAGKEPASIVRKPDATMEPTRQDH